MRNVNTIEFNGRKAVLNSFSDHPLLQADMQRQRETWTARFPNATVRTERMSDADCMALVAAEPDRHATWDIGEASNACPDCHGKGCADCQPCYEG